MTTRRWLRYPRLHTLRAQILAGTVALMLIVFALIGVVTVVALHTFLDHRLDQELSAAGNRFSVGLEHPSDHDADNDPSQFQGVSGQSAGTLGARIVNGSVTAAAVVVGGDEAPARVSDEAREVLGRLTASGEVREIRLPGLGSYRVTVTNGADGDLLVTGLPTRPVDDIIDRLVIIELVVFAGALVVVALVNAGFVRFATRPLERVAETASAVAELPMSSGAVSIEERAPVPKARDGEAGQVAVALNRLLDQVDSALGDRQRSEDRLRLFIADASHELRTPVAVVRAHADFAMRAAEETPADVVRALRRIAAESERMGRLVDDLLLLARLDAGRPLVSEEVDLTRIALESVGDAKVTGPEHGWQLDLPEEPVTVPGDDHALRQVVANLLANVRAHTPPGTTARLRIVPTPDGGASLTVEDNGPGLAPDLQARVFDRFVRGTDPRAASTTSSGLGLAIVAAIVSAHHGSVDLSSSPGGIAVQVELPGR
ncbi:MAG: HAMP domain-containing histidine kinase [Actinomycetota bacterium]|nr:HAMP domain-containing histidine kinase [Actinomycetota bacterium]